MRIISGKFKGRVLYTPKTNTTRPTQGALRESLFNICQFEIENATFLDLFAGSGAIGFEALSRGASHVTFVESNRIAVHAIKKNIAILDVSSQIHLFPLDSNVALDKIRGNFDIIYVDPPYEMSVTPILKKIGDLSLLKVNGNLFVETRAEKQKEVKIDYFQLRSSRKFGSALLLHYTK